MKLGLIACWLIDILRLQHNVLISDDGVGQLCDFGLVSLAETQGPTGLTTTSPYGGTARYKAPELVPSRDNRDPKPNYASDIYAFGCITYEVRLVTLSSCIIITIRRKSV
jgi:serine/threonine protein kinase